MSSTLPPIPVQVPPADPRTGVLTPVWADWFQKLFQRVGGSVADTNTEILNIASGAVLGYTPENQANKSTTGTLGTSDTLYPTQHAVKTYVDTGLAGKQATGSYITVLTGDVTASGPGSSAATLANSGVSAGSYTNANITVDAKGRVTVASSGSSGSSGFTTGDVKLTLKTTADSTWVMMDDGTIGDGSSGATTRANADTSDLFALLWNNVSDTYAPVSGGRGASAAADFAAHKKISLTKVLGRSLAVAGAGSGLTSRSLGQTLGEETHVLTTSEMPSHTHTLNAYGNVPAISANFATSSDILRSTSGGPTNSTGGDGAHNNMQPTSFLNVMVKL